MKIKMGEHFQENTFAKKESLALHTRTHHMSDAHAKILQSVQQSVSHICSDATKAFLRNSASAASSSTISDAEICHFLAAHFQAQAETKQRENRLCVSPADVKHVAAWIFSADSNGSGKNNSSNSSSASFVFPARLEETAAAFLAQRQNNKKEQDSSANLADVASAILAMPRISQRDITSFLQAEKMNSSALPEAFEMCRAVNQLLQKQAAAATIKPAGAPGAAAGAAFGTVNSVQFLAVFASLTLIHSHFDLLSLLLDVMNGNATAKRNSNNNGGTNSTFVVQMLCASYALIDSANAKMWSAVVQVLSRYPGATTELLLELVPSIETMGMPGSSFMDDVETRVSGDATKSAIAAAGSPVAVKIVSYNPEDEGGDGSKKKLSNNDDDDDNDEEEKDSEENQRARQDFWSGLTAPRN